MPLHVVISIKLLIHRIHRNVVCMQDMKWSISGCEILVISHIPAATFDYYLSFYRLRLNETVLRFALCRRSAILATFSSTTSLLSAAPESADLITKCWVINPRLQCKVSRRRRNKSGTHCFHLRPRKWIFTDDWNWKNIMIYLRVRTLSVPWCCPVPPVRETTPTSGYLFWLRQELKEGIRQQHTNSDKPSRQHQIINARHATRALLALWSHISVSVHFKLVFLVQVNFRLTALNVVDFWLLFRGGACCLLLFREHLQKYYRAFFTQRRAQRCVAIV